MPLNTEAVLRLAIALHVHPTEIMPELLPDQDNIKGKDQERGNDSARLTDEALAFASSWQALDDNQKQALAATLKAFKHKP